MSVWFPEPLHGLAIPPRPLATTMKILLAACTLLALTSCSTTPADQPAVEAGVINTVCPLQGDPVTEGLVVEYKGHMIGLCCDGCMTGWPDLTDAQKDEALATALK